MPVDRPDDDVAALRERAKELRCLYDVISALSRREDPLPVVFSRVLDAIPQGWQFPEDVTARVEYFGRSHARPDFVETSWRQRSPLTLWRTTVGAVEVVYRSEHPPAWEGPFLREERELLDNVAHRLGEYLEWKQRELGGERLGAPPEHWRWRQRFAESLAAALDPVRFGVEKAYLYGSTHEGTAGPGSDIDLLFVFRGDERQRHDLELWLEGWSLCLAEVSLQMNGLPGRGMLGVRFIPKERAAAELAAFVRSGAPPRELPLRAR